MAEASKVEFARRRRALMRLMGRGAIAIVPSAPVRQRNNDVEYNYRQDSDFYYLTGFSEPEAVAVLIPGREAAEYVLFVRERNKEREIWDGKRAGPDGAVAQYGADDAFPITDIDEILPGMMESRERVFYTMGLNQEFDQRVVGWVNSLRAQARSGLHPPQEFVALDHALHDMRLFKSRGEIGLMRRAGQIAAGAHVRGMRFCRPGRMEYEVMAELLHEFNRHGADISYHPIVGGGATGVELSAELRNTAQVLSAYGLHRLDPRHDVGIVLIEAGPRILPALQEPVSTTTAELLQKLGVKLMVSETVAEVTPRLVRTAVVSGARGISGIVETMIIG